MKQKFIFSESLKVNLNSTNLREEIPKHIIIKGNSKERKKTFHKAQKFIIIETSVILKIYSIVANNISGRKISIVVNFDSLSSNKQ